MGVVCLGVVCMGVVCMGGVCMGGVCMGVVCMGVWVGRLKMRFTGAKQNNQTPRFYRK